MQLDDGVAAGADGVGVAGADRAVVGEDADERRLLADEGLDRIGPLHLGDEVDHEDLDPLDPCHRRPPFFFSLAGPRRAYSAASGSVSSTAWMRPMIALLVVS